MSYHNVYYVYSHYSKEYPIPFYIGVGKQEALHKSIKNGRAVQKEELLRRILYDKDLLKSQIIVSQLTMRHAETMADQFINVIKSEFGGCFYDETKTEPASLAVTLEVIRSYFPHLITYKLPIIPYYDKFTERVERYYTRLAKARIRLRKHRPSKPTPEITHRVDDPFAPFKDNE